MKTAIYIEDGVTQIVLTPENEFEKKAVDAVGRKDATVDIKMGQFYNCMGGWTRHGDLDDKKQSMIIRLEG